MVGDAVGHALVFIFLIDLLFGTWGALVVWQHYQRCGLSQLRHLFNYVVAFNVMVFGYLVAQYAFTNLIGDNPLAFPRHVLLISVGVYPIELALAWTAMRLGWDLRHRMVPAHSRGIFVACATAIGLSYVGAVTTLMQGGNLQWLVTTHMVLGVAMTVAVTSTFVSLVGFSGSELHTGQRRSVRCLGWCLLVGYLALAGSAVLPQTAHLFTLAATLLWLNCVPLLWVRFRFDLYFDVSQVGQGAEVLARIVEEHGITPREREVMELIVRGMSNKEIEDELFISFSTVKNHAYNLYRKMGVRSRAQLIHKVMASTSGSQADVADG